MRVTLRLHTIYQEKRQHQGILMLKANSNEVGRKLQNGKKGDALTRIAQLFIN
jgi:hypothetical protein